MGKEVAWGGYFQSKENIHSNQYRESTLEYIVIFMKEKRIQYYDSNCVGAGKKYMDSVLQYLVNEDKGQGHVKPEEWALVPSTESIPKQDNLSDCGAFICMFGYFISQGASLLFSQANVTGFQK
jgi:Ulp1 family protease